MLGFPPLNFGSERRYWIAVEVDGIDEFAPESGTSATGPAHWRRQEEDLMGYDLHIIRGKEWSDPERPQVSVAEWRSIVEADSELQLHDQTTDTSSAGETVEYSNEGLAMWTAHPDRSAVWLDYRGGSIVAKNPDEPTIAKLLQIASGLDARVQGDDGEFYGPAAADQKPRGRKRRWPFRPKE